MAELTFLQFIVALMMGRNGGEELPAV